jgi:hypothetical protein
MKPYKIDFTDYLIRGNSIGNEQMSQSNNSLYTVDRVRADHLYYPN